MQLDGEGEELGDSIVYILTATCTAHSRNHATRYGVSDT